MAHEQGRFALAFGGLRITKDAPDKVVRQIESDGQALAVAMQAGGHKCASVAAAIGKSEGYVSRLRSGQRPIPDRLVGPLCAATGSSLIAQYRQMVAALSECNESHVDRLVSLLRQAA